MKKEEEEIAAKVRRVAEAATRPKTTPDGVDFHRN